MRTVIVIPPLPRMTGGIAVLYQVADRLRECGKRVTLTGVSSAPGLKSQAEKGHAVVPWETIVKGDKEFTLGPEDTFIVAEGWPNLMAPALAVGVTPLVYVQNWAYVFSALPPDVSWEKLPVRFFAVSDPVAKFMEDLAGLPISGIVRPMIDTSLFRQGSNSETSPKSVRIAWMPRKNKAIAEHIRQITIATLNSSGIRRVRWVEIHNMPPAQVAQTLSSCHIFLSVGFPEGCPLPPLEAMASGCLVVGFSGHGGWDYMRQAVPGQFTPRVPLRFVPWRGNGLFAADGDIVEAAYLLCKAVAMVAEGSGRYGAIRENAVLAAASYSKDAQREEVRLLWDALEEGAA